MSLNTIGAAIIPRIEYFEVIKAPPSYVIDVDIFDDETYRVNNLYKKLFQFRYRFVYDDNEKSVWSAISKVPIPSNSTDPFFNALSNKQNAISLKFPTGDINVAKIEIAGRVNIENQWSDFFLIDTLDKKRDKVNNNVIYTYIFKNDSVYTAIDLQESNLLFDYVPDRANALELANGNTLVVGGLKDGYNRDTELDVVVTNLSNLNSPAIVSTLAASVRNSSNSGPFQGAETNHDGKSCLPNPFVAGCIEFSGVPQVGDIVTIQIKGHATEIGFNALGQDNSPFRRNFVNTWSATAEAGWGIPDIINYFINHPDRLSGLTLDGVTPAWNVDVLRGKPSVPFGIPHFTPSNSNCLYFGAFWVNQCDARKWRIDSVSINIKRSFSFGESDVFPVYKWSGLYKFGLVYYDKNGKTNGVYTNPSMNLITNKYNTDYLWTPPTSEVVIPESETAQIYIGHTPPPWAKYYHLVRTKELSCDFSLMVITSDVRRSGGYVYLDIENLIATNVASKETSKVIKYGPSSFVDGDRVRIMHIYDSASKTTVWDDYEALDLPILSVEGSPSNPSRLELKLKDIDTSSNPDIITFGDNYRLIVEIYRPAKVLSDEDLVYYEIGYKYDILIDQNNNRFHQGQKTVSGVTIEQVQFTGTTKFYSSTKTIEVINPKRSFSLSEGDKISFSGSSLNNNIFTVLSFSQEIVNNIWTGFINVSENVIDENNITGAIVLSKLTKVGKNYAYINMFNDGDYYYRTRTMVCDTTPSNFGPFIVADKNFSETFLSAVWSQGRPLVVDENAKEEYYPAMLRFSQSYIPGTNINNLSRFYPNNFEDADASFGDILRLKTRENFIRIFQRFKTGMIPIYRQIIIDNAQSSQVALSERLLNKPNYYSGEYGIDKYGSSLVSTDYGDYFVDTINKAIVRVSLDGVTNISDTNDMASWANSHIKESSFGFGCFNYENRNVVMYVGHIEPIQDEVSYNIISNIIAYSEPDKKFESFYGFTDAENMLFANGFILTFKDGMVYIHDSETRNNFYGEQQSSTITTVFNNNMQLKKTYLAIEELSTDIWYGELSTGPLTNQETTFTVSEFQKPIGGLILPNKENKFNTTIKRAENKPGGKFFGESMKGLYATVELNNDSSSHQRLISVSLKYIQSPLTNM